MSARKLRPPMRSLASAAWALLFGLLATSPASAQEVVEYYATDQLGSIRVVFDASGNIVSRADYLPFGEELAASGPMPAEHFTGQARDAEAGMDYFHARQYQPRSGRFNAVDPVYAGLFLPQKWNRYAYVLNNPLALTDPTGLEPYMVQYCPPSSGSCVQMPSEAAGVATAGPRSNIGFMSVDMGRAERTAAFVANMSFVQRWQQSQKPSQTNVSTTTVITFDGKTITLVDGEKKKSWDAVSGREGFQDPKFQGEPGKGPIPEGSYMAFQKQLQERGLLDTLLGLAGRGAWPGGGTAWGDYRIWLDPDASTNTRGRDGFSIHGGSYPGSAGCIDLCGGMNSFVDVFRGTGKDIPVVVTYPK